MKYVPRISSSIRAAVFPYRSLISNYRYSLEQYGFYQLFDGFLDSCFSPAGAPPTHIRHRPRCYKFTSSELLSAILQAEWSYTTNRPSGTDTFTGIAAMFPPALPKLRTSIGQAVTQMPHPMHELFLLFSSSCFRAKFITSMPT